MSVSNVSNHPPKLKLTRKHKRSPDTLQITIKLFNLTVHHQVVDTFLNMMQYQTFHTSSVTNPYQMKLSNERGLIRKFDGISCLEHDKSFKCPLAIGAFPAENARFKENFLSY